MSAESYRSKLEKLLNPPQLEAATHVDGPLLILAGAGSGKTRTITYRAAYLLESGIPAKNILCVTFTNKAAREMKERISRETGRDAAKKLTISTFHSFCVRLLFKYAGRLGFPGKFNIYNSSDQRDVYDEILKDLGINAADIPLDDIRSAVSNAKNDLIAPDEYPRTTPFEKAAAVIYKNYQQYLFHMGAMDFDDMIYYAARILEDFPEVLKSVQRRFRYIMIDEYQDTNKAQYRIARLIAGEKMNIVVVGDDDQSIYGWRGADIKNILDFEKDFAGTKTVKLEQNYRSTSVILDAANAIIKNNKERKAKTLWSGLGEGDKIRITAFKDPYEEARYVASDIMHRAERLGLRWNDFAVLFRTNAQAKALESAFFEYAVPYYTSGKLDFYARSEIRSFMAYLRLLHNPLDDLSLLRIVNFPRRGISDKTVRTAKAYAMEAKKPVFEALRMMANQNHFKPQVGEAIHHFASLIENYGSQMTGRGFCDILEEFFHTIDFTAAVGAMDKDQKVRDIRRRNVARMFENIKLYIKKARHPSLKDYLFKLALFFNSENEDDDIAADEVNLLTIHASKGLEFPYVYLVGLEENMIPFVRDASSDVNIQEERRLCYVAMTRAEKKLTLTLCRTRRRDKNLIECVPSRFLAEIPDPLVIRNYGNFSSDEEDPHDEIRKEDDDAFAERIFEEMRQIVKNKP